MYNMYWALVHIALFCVLASKGAFDLSNKHLAGLLGPTADAAGPTHVGLVVHAALFVLAGWAVCYGARYLGFSAL